MWKDYLNEFMDYNDWDIYNKKKKSPLKKKVKTVLAFGASLIPSFFAPILFIPTFMSIAWYGYGNYKSQKIKRMVPTEKATNIKDDSKTVAEVKAKKAASKNKIENLENDLKKSQRKRTIFHELGDVSRVLNVIPIGVSFFYPPMIPFAIATTLLHRYVGHKEIQANLECKNTDQKIRNENQKLDAYKAQKKAIKEAAAKAKAKAKKNSKSSTTTSKANPYEAAVDALIDKLASGKEAVANVADNIKAKVFGKTK